MGRAAQEGEPVPVPTNGRLRFITYLVPSLPRALFDLLARGVGEALNVDVSLEVETGLSGPPCGAPDPFSRDEADVGFLCSPTYLWLRDRRPSPVELVPVAPVFEDPRNEGRPVYFSDVIVRRDSDARSFEDLRGRTWAYNDPYSLSGYFSFVRRLVGLPEGGHFLGAARLSGSHLNSLGLVARGEVDAATIDSNVLTLVARTDPSLVASVRVIESSGPLPVYPVVVRSRLDPGLKARLASALHCLDRRAGMREALRAFAVRRFAPVDEQLYESERAALDACRRVNLALELAPRPERAALGGAGRVLTYPDSRPPSR